MYTLTPRTETAIKAALIAMCLVLVVALYPHKLLGNPGDLVSYALIWVAFKIQYLIH
jgi:hypothetical protein